MWGGSYIDSDDIEKFSRTEDLLGISTYNNYDNFEMDDDDIWSENCRDKIKFIDENNKQWKRIDVWDEARKYFDWKKTYSVKYSDYLVNHSQKLAIDLADYHEQSKYVDEKSGIERAVDLVSILTETGGGSEMVLYDGKLYEIITFHYCDRMPPSYVKVEQTEKGIRFISRHDMKPRLRGKKLGITECTKKAVICWQQF